MRRIHSHHGRVAERRPCVIRIWLAVFVGAWLGLAGGCGANPAAIKAKAEQGDSAAQFQLGQMYANGQGLRQDYQEARRWYQAAADQENPDAELNLGLMYARGMGVAKDYNEAIRWFQKAAAHGNAKAQYYLSGTR